MVSAKYALAGKVRRVLRRLRLLPSSGEEPRPSAESSEPAPASAPVPAPVPAPLQSTKDTTVRNERTIPLEEPFRHFLPGALFIITFVTVITTLLVYMDNTAMKQQQFRRNMRREDELAKVAQDDDALVAYIRRWQLTSAAKPFPPHSRHPPIVRKPEIVTPTPTENVVARLLDYKRNGVFVEAGAYGAGSGGGSRTEWLEEALEWRGLLATPDAHDYFRLRARRTAPGTLTTHACLSTSTHPKEITYQENRSREEVGVLALGNAGEEFSARVKCFPLYSLLLAARHRNVDFLSISCGGCEFAALASLPRDDRVRISVVEIVGKQTVGVEGLLLSKGYGVVTKTPSSAIYAVRDIPASKI